MGSTLTLSISSNIAFTILSAIIQQKKETKKEKKQKKKKKRKEKKGPRRATAYSDLELLGSIEIRFARCSPARPSCAKTHQLLCAV
jgi:hypothetical protein